MALSRYVSEQFDFLGYGFRPRLVRRSRDNTLFWAFTPAFSASALKAMRAAIWELNLRHRTELPMNEIARQINPLLRGWIAAVAVAAVAVAGAGVAVAAVAAAAGAAVAGGGSGG